MIPDQSSTALGLLPGEALVAAMVALVVSAMSHSCALPMEVLPILDVVDLGDELFLDRLTRMKTVKGLANHELEVVVCLLNLTDIDRLELHETSKTNCQY